LIEDNSARSQATSLLNIDATYHLTKSLRLTGEIFNILNAADSDVDYYYASRLPGEPADGINDYHFHPTIPRTARISLIFNLR
jgi:hypothetical protein